ncbi:YrhK family protein [Virgibacillus sp. CBA3643]|uniref:YrhK family protein n=1 Tax=Virgibacillus sp. CBA3643 TaxID=2942278 RepID=UPI0035A2C812
MPKITNGDNYVQIQIGKFEILFNKGYRLLTLVNDLTLGIWYITVSILLISGMTVLGSVFFLMGSLQLFGRAVLKIIHAFYVQKAARTGKESNGFWHQ